MKKICLFAAGIALLVFTSCRHQPDLANLPAISFKNDVQPILGGNCSQSGCHGNSNTARFPLVTYDDVLRRVSPGNARGSSLYTAILGEGTKIMPPSSQPSLTDQEITLIYVWIEQGAKDN